MEHLTRQGASPYLYRYPSLTYLVFPSVELKIERGTAGDIARIVSTTIGYWGRSLPCADTAEAVRQDKACLVPASIPLVQMRSGDMIARPEDLPILIQHVLQHGYTISHMGLLCDLKYEGVDADLRSLAAVSPAITF